MGNFKDIKCLYAPSKRIFKTCALYRSKVIITILICYQIFPNPFKKGFKYGSEQLRGQILKAGD